jgi:hypothetical protein
LNEKGNKRHEMPVHPTLEVHLSVYLDVAQLHDSGKTPLFHSAVWYSGVFTEIAMHCIDAYHMI